MKSSNITFPALKYCLMSKMMTTIPNGLWKKESECEEDQINDDDDNWMIGVINFFFLFLLLCLATQNQWIMEESECEEDQINDDDDDDLELDD